jgi:hypothetical protein
MPSFYMWPFSYVHPFHYTSVNNMGNDSPHRPQIMGLRSRYIYIHQTTEQTYQTNTADFLIY